MPACWRKRRRRAGSTPPPWVKTSLAPGLARGDDLSRSRRAVGAAGGAGLSRRRLRLHHLRREIGSAQAGDRQGRRAAAAAQWRRCFPATAISTAASIGWSARTICARRRWSSPLRSPGASPSTSTVDPIATDPSGAPVFLRDLWPDDADVDAAVRQAVTPDVFVSTAQAEPAGARRAGTASRRRAASCSNGTRRRATSSSRRSSPRRPSASRRAQRVAGARVLGIYADGLTTDHVSPGGEIPPDSPAGQYLQSIGVRAKRASTAMWAGAATIT